MSQAIVVSEPVSRRIELEVGDVSLSEKMISDAITSAYFQITPAGSSAVDEVEELVAQLFDALEEKNLAENMDIEEYETSLLPVQALGASALEFGKLAHFLAARDFSYGHLGVDSAIEYMLSLEAEAAGLQGPALCSDCVEALEQDLDDEKATVAALEYDLEEEITCSNLNSKILREQITQLEIKLAEEKKGTEYLALQIGDLANFILKSVAGEPSKNQGAVDTAIRIISQLQEQSAQLTIVNRTLNNALKQARAELDEARSKIAKFIYEENGNYPYSDGPPPTLTNPLPASFTLKNDVPTPYQAPKSGLGFDANDVIKAVEQVTGDNLKPSYDGRYYENCTCDACLSHRRCFGGTPAGE